jgi:hypothetical protein
MTTDGHTYECEDEARMDLVEDMKPIVIKWVDGTIELHWNNGSKTRGKTYREAIDAARKAWKAARQHEA